MLDAGLEGGAVGGGDRVVEAPEGAAQAGATAGGAPRRRQDGQVRQSGLETCRVVLEVDAVPAAQIGCRRLSRIDHAGHYPSRVEPMASADEELAVIGTASRIDPDVLDQILRGQKRPEN